VIQIEKARDIAFNNPLQSASDIYERTVGELSKESQMYAPKSSVVKRSLYRYKRSAYSFPEPSSLGDMQIPQTLWKTIGGEEFLRFDSEDNRRILVFTTNDNLNVRYRT
jgi:hypothetical protein